MDARQPLLSFDSTKGVRLMLQVLSTLRAFLKRVGIYTWEMFPPYRVIPLILLQFFGFYFCLALASGQTAVLSSSLWSPLVTLFFTWFLLRCFDELKDQDVDAQCFPHRPVVRGATTYTDIRILILLNLTLLVGLNLGKGLVTDAFMVMIVYMILSWQWYLFESIVSPNIFLVLLTHQWWMPLNFVYIAAVFVGLSGQAMAWQTLALVIFLFWLPGGLLLEIGRKIRAPEQEDDYLSYTKRWGTTRACLFLLGINIGVGISWFSFGIWLGLPWFVAGIFLLMSALLGTLIVRFIQNPRKSNNFINLFCQIYVGLVYLFPLVIYASR